MLYAAFTFFPTVFRLLMADPEETLARLLVAMLIEMESELWD